MYVVVKTVDGPVAVDHLYQGLGFVVDPSWDELKQHPACLFIEPDDSFDDGNIRGEAIYLDLDLNRPTPED